MISVNFVRDKSGLIRKFTIMGHAGFEEAGRDVICSAVSAIAYTALGGMEELVGILNHTEKDGFMKFYLPVDIEKDKEKTARIILDTMAIGLKQIENSYGEYIEVIEEEV